MQWWGRLLPVVVLVMLVITGRGAVHAMPSPNTAAASLHVAHGPPIPSGYPVSPVYIPAVFNNGGSTASSPAATPTPTVTSTPAPTVTPRSSAIEAGHTSFGREFRH